MGNCKITFKLLHHRNSHQQSRPCSLQKESLRFFIKLLHPDTKRKSKNKERKKKQNASTKYNATDKRCTEKLHMNQRNSTKEKIKM